MRIKINSCNVQFIARLQRFSISPCIGRFYCKGKERNFLLAFRTNQIRQRPFLTILCVSPQLKFDHSHRRYVFLNIKLWYSYRIAFRFKGRRFLVLSFDDITAPVVIKLFCLSVLTMKNTKSKTAKKQQTMPEIRRSSRLYYYHKCMACNTIPDKDIKLHSYG